jgi:hypothetical protein
MLTVVLVDTNAGNFVPETGANVEVETPQEFPSASRVVCKISVKLYGTGVGAGETELQEIGPPAPKQIVKNPLPLPANLPARLASVTPPSSWAWLTLTGPPIMVAIKSNNPSPVAMRSFLNFIAGTPLFCGFIEFSPFPL